MSFARPAAIHCAPWVLNEETMLEVIRWAGIIPLTESVIPGWSIEEHTPPELWFGEETLGPWDWKIHCVQSGDIAYGKFVLGGKAAFATVDVFRELMNWRRSLPKYAPDARQQQVLDYLKENGSMGIKDVRGMFGMKKLAADALMADLQRKTRIVIGDITRVYRGQDLHYNGWQSSIFCTPEALFEDDADFPFPGFVPRTLKSSLTPSESRDFVVEAILRTSPGASAKQMDKVLGHVT